MLVSESGPKIAAALTPRAANISPAPPTAAHRRSAPVGSAARPMKIRAGTKSPISRVWIAKVRAEGDWPGRASFAPETSRGRHAFFLEELPQQECPGRRLRDAVRLVVVVEKRVRLLRPT